MSIINDALKKAREERDRNIQEPGQPPQPSTKEDIRQGKPEAEIPRHRRQKAAGSGRNKKAVLRRILFVAGLIALISSALFIMVRQDIKGVVYRFLVTQKEDKPLPEPSKTVDQPAPILPQAPLEVEGPGPIVTEMPEFELTGIVYGEGSPMAIINGSVYMVGDKVNTAKVLRISEDMVLLEKDGVRIELTVK